MSLLPFIALENFLLLTCLIDTANALGLATACIVLPSARITALVLSVWQFLVCCSVCDMQLALH